MDYNEFLLKWPVTSWPFEYGLDKIMLQKYKAWFEEPDQIVSDWDAHKYNFVCDALKLKDF